jgi:hypothetical protein
MQVKLVAVARKIEQVRKDFLKIYAFLCNLFKRKNTYSMLNS